MTLLLECAVRAALVATGTAVILWALRIRTAAAKHAAWTAVVLAMLLLPIWLAGGLRLSLPVLRPTTAAAGIATTNPGNVVADALPQPEAMSPTAPAVARSARQAGWDEIVFGAYLVGAAVLLVRLALGTVQANRLRRSAVMDAGRATSGRCTTPITVGWFQPELILPSGWARWPAAKLDAVLTHEREPMSSAWRCQGMA